jgi:hypothetical protein
LVDVVYAYGGFGSKVGDDVRGRVNEFGSLDELAGKLGSANGRVAVVVRSTTDAIRLRDRLGNAEVIYLPKYYEDAAKEVLSGGVPGVAGVRHEGLGEGISPSMLREGVPSEVVESIRKLSPGKLGLGDLIKDFLKKAPIDAAVQAITLGLSFLLGAGVAVSLVSSLAGRFLEMVVGRWRKNKDEVIGGFARLVNAAREVRDYLGDERFESVVDEVAYEWGLNIEEFANTITNIANITAKQLTEEDIKKIINDKLESIEEALKKIEEELRRVRERVGGLLAGVEVFFINDFEDGLAYPTVRLVDGKLMVLGEYGYHEIVRTSSFGALASEVGRRLGAGSLVVLTGPKGVGKSTLATVTIWNLLRIGEAGMVLRIRELPDGEVVESFRSFIENFLVRDWEYFGKMIILYDPTGVYGQIGGVEAPSKLETTVRNVLEAVMKAVENAKSILGREPSARVGVLIILPTDLYNALSNDVKDKLESYRLDAPLNDVEFLAGLIREYMKMRDKPSGCSLSNDVLSKLASELAKFDSGHALIARLIGEELARSNCDVGRIEELISNAKGKAEAFIIQYINKLFKVHEDPDVAKALVEIFALRRPFVSMTRPGVPILTPGIIKLISEKREAKLLYSAVGEELRSWLAIRQHDLIEGAIEELLDCIVGKGEECGEPGGALEPWKTIGVMESLGKVSEVKDVGSAVKYFVKYYGGDLTGALRSFGNCWKRAAYIIGYASAGRVLVPRPEDLRKDVAESLGDALRECGVDGYLLVGGKIPPLIWYLVKNHARALTEAFIDEYNEAVVEVRRVRDIVKYRDRGISSAEAFYGLGLASIIAKAVESGKPIEPSDADAALRMASSAIQDVASPDLIRPILDALVPLRGKAPQRYIELLAPIPEIENLDSDTVRYIFKELNEILDNYGDVVRGYAWSLVHAIRAYADLLRRYRIYLYFSDEVKGAVRKIADLLNELDKFKTSLGVIAWAYALAPALEYEDIMKLMMETLRINKVDKVIDKASEVAKELGRLRKKVKELIRDEEFVGYIKSRFVKADEGTVKIVILEAASLLKHALAHYRLYNDELNEVEELSNEAAKEYREIGDYENYLTARSWALRAEAIKDSLAGDELTKLRNEFQRLYEETFSKEHFKLTAQYLGVASGTLCEYLVSLALTGDDKKINELLEEHWLVLRINEQVSVLTRLVLNALLGSKDRKDQLGSELKDKLGINSWELINAFGSDIYMYIEFLPALRVALGIAKPKDETAVCKLIKDSMKRRDCRGAVLAAVDDSDAIWWLRWELIYNFYERILEKERSGWLRELGFDANVLISEFGKLVGRLDGKSLVQLIAPETSIARLALMLYALVNGNEKLAKAHALMGTTDLIRESEFISWFWFISMIISKSKLLTRLFLEAYETCCDLGSEEFRRAIASLFFLHV